MLRGHMASCAFIIAVLFLAFITACVAEIDAGWRWCFICVSSGPGTVCEADPAAVKDSINHMNCTRPYCTVKRIEHGDSVWSFSRGCQPVSFGNQCHTALGGNQRTCYTTCSRSWCNSGTGIPPPPRRRRLNGATAAAATPPLIIILGAAIVATRIAR